MSKYGVINEVGDLGLGFDPVSEEEEKVIEESKKSDNTENK